MATGGAAAGGAGVGGAGGDSTTGTAAGGGGAEPFVLEVYTELDGAEVLALRTNLPRRFADCGELLDAPCADADGDGLNDAWEDVVLSRLRPFVRLDEAEPLVNEPAFVSALVGRVTPAEPYIHAYMMLGYARDFGTCGGFTAHNGDSERVALQLEILDEGAGDVRVRKAYTAAHEGTAIDHGMIFEDADLATLVHEADSDFDDEPRWVVFASAAKHATYATIAICEGISVLPCADEDCAPDGVNDLTPFTLLMPYVNAGEPSSPLATDLSVVGFDGEDAWLDQPFCGGLGGTGCSSAVVEKLTISPF